MSEESRQIAEAVGSDRDRRAREVRLRAERRERIATAVYASMFTATKLRPTVQERGMWAAEAVAAADALMAELDLRRDAELAEARA